MVTGNRLSARFRNAAIKKKLIVLMLVITSVSLLLSGASFITLDYLHARERFVDKMRTLSDVMATNVAAPLVQGDPDAAKDTLMSMKVAELVMNVFIHSADGKLLVQYHRSPKEHFHIENSPARSIDHSPAHSIDHSPAHSIDHSPEHSSGPSARFWSLGSLDVFSPIVFDGRRVGMVHLVADLSELHERIGRSLAIGLLLTVVLIGLAMLMATVGHGLITLPILSLTREMRRVSREQDYSVRAEKTSEDELGELVDGFNGMLGAIGARDQELARYREGLEEQVHTRTAQLEQRNRELTHAIADAEATSLSKSQFLANMSHEIRTPMNGVLGMAALLGDTGLDQRQQRFLHTIKTSGESLLTVVNDVLDFSKVEAGYLEIAAEPFDLHQTVEDVAALLAPAARTNRIELMTFIGNNVPPRVLGDRSRLRQILTNLVGNAAKFTEKGEVTLSVRCVAGQAGLLSFEVRDTGIGIAADHQGKLFDTFHQADNTAARRFSGTGLGLAIVRQLVEKMGGKVAFESALGKGSRFWFDIELTEAEGVVPATPVAIGPFNVLVVDDSETALEVIGAYIDQWGWRVRTAVSGEDAFAQLASAKARGDRFDLVILDIVMAGLDGNAVANRIWSQPETAELPVIFLTAFDALSAEGHQAEHGRSAYLTKPVRREELLNSIGKVMAGAPVASTTPGPIVGTKKAPPFHGRNALLAEDNPVNQEVSREHLLALGFEVDLAEDGAEAIQAYQRRGFDIILMDCQMPGIDGFEATLRIRELEARSPGRRRTPIVALTAHAMESDREICLASGMDDYLSKPFRPDVLEATIGHWVEAGCGEAAISDATLGADSVLDPGATGDGPVLNHSALDGLRSLRRDGAPDPVKRVVGL